MTFVTAMCGFTERRVISVWDLNYLRSEAARKGD